MKGKIMCIIILGVGPSIRDSENSLEYVLGITEKAASFVGRAGLEPDIAVRKGWMGGPVFRAANSCTRPSTSLHFPCL